jgi:hypothetical protein
VFHPLSVCDVAATGVMCLLCCPRGVSEEQNASRSFASGAFDWLVRDVAAVCSVIIIMLPIKP